MKFSRWFLVISLSLFCTSFFVPLSAEAKFALFKKKEVPQTTSSEAQVDLSVQEKKKTENEASAISSLRTFTSSQAMHYGSENPNYDEGKEKTLPKIKFLSPADGEVVGGIVTVKIDATDDVGVTKVTVKPYSSSKELLGKPYVAGQPYEFEWDTTALPVGKYDSLIAFAYDQDGNGNVAHVSVKIGASNPALLHTADLSPAAQKSSLDNAAFAQNGKDVPQVAEEETSKDASTIEAALPEYKTFADDPSLKEGDGDVTGQAGLLRNNELDGDRTPPDVVIVAPGDGDTVSKTIQIQVSATDAGGVAKVEITPCEEPTITLTSAPYMISWDTTKTATGSCKIQATATDNSGEVSQVKISVRVENQIVSEDETKVRVGTQTESENETKVRVGTQTESENEVDGGAGIYQQNELE